MKNRIVLIVIIMLFSLLCNSCKDKHVHEYVNGKCECGEIDSNYIPPHEHVFSDIIVDPTCTVDGTVYSSCECGYSKTTTIPAIGHSFIDGICSCGEKEEINVTYVVVFKDIDGNVLKEEKI